MGRKKTIDRDAVLDAAEAIVMELGTGRLTFDEIAKRACVSKGGVLYCFASKQDLVAAMVRRDLDRFSDDVARHRDEAGHADDLKAHLAATRHESDVLAARAASLMAVLAETPEHAAPVREYYRGWFARFDPNSESGRRARMAFLAAEGAFLLRGMGMMDFSEDEWRDMFVQMENFASGS
ncbi:TetR/AcrR family transcriptional regulator [Mesorhizobium sp. CAU 1741]|uniref:TetR/AcrR family transcriptional regulator n=1 Tax=Mesorhizobium sp. CAU 1741 TaxID=3140366 RepID=UPI00325AF390